MEIIETLVLSLHILAAVATIGVVLLQQGKGAEMGSGFGAGASATVFGSAGSGNFLTRTTTILALTFFLTSFGLAYIAREKARTAAGINLPGFEVQEVIPQPDEFEEEIEIPSLPVDPAG